MEPSNYSGNLITDGKYVPTKDCVPDPRDRSDVPRSKKRRKIKKGLVFITNVDYHTHDLPHLNSDLSENYFIFDRNFRTLKEDLDYPLKSLTCDKKSEIVSSCLEYYPETKIQLCLAHYSREIKRKLAVQGIKKTIESLEKRLNKLQNKQSSSAIELIRRINKLGSKYRTLIEFQDLMLGIIFAKNIKEKEERLNYLEKIFFKRDFKPELLPKEHRRKILKVYQAFVKNQEFLFTHLEYPELKIPYTTNLLEGINGHLEDRLTAIRGFESRETAENYLNALILQRRFKSFKSCRKRFTHLNGKSPLEIVKAKNISKIKKNWIRFCLKKH